MSMIDPYEPTYTFSYKEITPKIKYIKDGKGKVHKIKIVEKIIMHNVASGYRGGKIKEPTIYFKYQVRKKNNIFIKFLEKVCKEKRELWIDIEPKFYSEDFYSSFYPRGIIQEECLYNTYEEAKNGKETNLYRGL